MRTNTRMKLTALAAAMGMAVSFGALAGNTAEEEISFEVTAINEIAVTGTPTLTVNAATAGAQPTPAEYTDGNLAVTTNGTNKKLSAAITTGGPMPDDTTLEIKVDGVGTGGTYVPVGTVAADLVTGITEVADDTNQVSYKLTALVTAGIVASGSKTVTFTLADGS
jgi:hypothetical protein